MKEFVSPCALKTRLSLLGLKGLDKDFYCTENFAWHELLKNQTELPSLAVLNSLYKIAVILQKYRDTIFGHAPITITSGWRSESYNKKIGGAKNSYHVKGMALDFVVTGFTPQQVQKLLDPVFIGGMEYAPTWTHLDTRPFKARFKP